MMRLRVLLRVDRGTHRGQSSAAANPKTGGPSTRSSGDAKVPGKADGSSDVKSLFSDEHFTADDTLLQALAFNVSLERIDAEVPRRG